MGDKSQHPSVMSIITLGGSPLLAFFAVRLILLMAMPIDGLLGYGDYRHFFQLAALPGWPYLDYWVEFPPIFPFFSKVIYLLSGGVEHVYDYLLIVVMTLFDGGSVWLFSQLSRRLPDDRQTSIPVWIYSSLLAAFPYNWWYFDPLVVFFLLLFLYLWMKRKVVPAGLALAVGALAKFFPLVTLAAVWKDGSSRMRFWVTALAVGLTLGGFLVLHQSSPEMTLSSLISQGKKGSWETVWALLDGNFTTGNFGPESERLDPGTAQIARGNPARLNPLLTLPVFLLIGLGIYLTSQIKTFEQWIAFTGISLIVLLLWMPGWSPQWVLYLIPLILLSLPRSEGILMSFVLIGISLLEWPVLLSRGYFWGLWLTIPLRTIVFIFLGMIWYRQIRKRGIVQVTESEVTQQ